MLTGTIHAGERFLMQQTGHTVTTGYLFHSLHNQLVVIYCNVGSLINGSQFMLCGSHFVVLCLRSYTQLPQFNVQVFHERTDSLTDSTEVMIFQLLSLGCGCTEQGTSGEDQIFTLQVFISVYQEIFLLRSNACYYLRSSSVAEQSYDTKCLGADSFHGTKKRCLFIQCLTLVRAESSGNAEDHAGSILFQECGRCDIPCSIASCLKGCS